MLLGDNKLFAKSSRLRLAEQAGGCLYAKEKKAASQEIGRNLATSYTTRSGSANCQIEDYGRDDALWHQTPEVGIEGLIATVSSKKRLRVALVNEIMSRRKKLRTEEKLFFVNKNS